MPSLKIKLVKSKFTKCPTHRKTLAALGLKRINQEKVFKDTPQIRGMIKQVKYLLECSETE